MFAAVLILSVYCESGHAENSILPERRYAPAGAFGWAKPGPGGKRATRWLDDNYFIGTNAFIDRMRGDPHGYNSSSASRPIGRKDDKKKPGDYLNWPMWQYPKLVPFVPDSVSMDKIENYVKDMLRPGFALDDIPNFVSEYRDIQHDTGRTEFFGRFIANGQKMSLGGWYDKFAVIGICQSYDDAKGFLSEAMKYFVLPELNPDSVKAVKEGSRYFYEYIDREMGFRLRGFDVQIITFGRHEKSTETKVVEFTKYYDEEFVP